MPEVLVGITLVANLVLSRPSVIIVDAARVTAEADLGYFLLSFETMLEEKAITKMIVGGGERRLDGVRERFTPPKF